MLRAQPGYGMRPVGIVETGPTTVGDVEAPVPSTRLPVLSTPEDIGRAVIRTTVRHALFVDDRLDFEDLGSAYFGRAVSLQKSARRT